MAAISRRVVDEGNVQHRGEAWELDDAALPEGWELKKTEDGRIYYVDHNTRTQTWTKPKGDSTPKRSINAAHSTGNGALSKEQLELSVTPSADAWMPQIFEVGNSRDKEWKDPGPGVYVPDAETYLRRTIAKARERDVPWPSEQLPKSKQVRVFVQGKELTGQDLNPRSLVNRLETLKGRQDDLCIIENITPEWIGRLGSRWNLPCEFFVGHAANPDFQMFLPTVESPKTRMLTQLHDLIERAWTMKDRLEKANMETDKLSSPSTTKDSSTTTPTKDILDRVTKLVEGMKTVVAGWDPFAHFSQNLGEELRTPVKLCSDSLDKFDVSEGKEIPVEGIDLKGLEEVDETIQALQHNCYYNLSGFFEYPERTFNETTHSEDSLYFSRLVARTPGTQNLCCNTNISYIRVDRSLCLLLVDRPLPESRLCVPDACRAPVQLRLCATYSRNGIVLPQLFSKPHYSLFEAVASVASHRWHMDVICGELAPLGKEILQENSNEFRLYNHTYPAMEAQAFLYLLASSLWETNLRYLEYQIQTISFRDIRNPKPSTNERLHEHREDLALLVKGVSAANALLPPNLNQYYNKFAIIKGRHNAALFSPVDNLRTIQDRAKELEQYLMNSFQLLISTLSVRDSQESIKQSRESNNQTRRATLITILAFIYIPTTTVTGIFGMNLEGHPNGFRQWVFGVTFTAIALFTVLLFFAAQRGMKRYYAWKDDQIKKADVSEEKPYKMA